MKVCAIVGAGPQMGLSIARVFGKAGYKLALISRSADHLATEARALEHMADYEVLGFPADASDPASLKNAFEHIKMQLAVPEVMVYNAAARTFEPPSTIDPSAVLDNFRINVIGALASAQQVIPTMKERGSGTLLFTGGGLSLNPRPEYTSLALGKAALRNLVGSMAIELSDHGIKVGTVTIAGYVNKQDGHDPDVIAKHYIELHNAPPSADNWEIIYPN